ncbi:hypothetical protein LSTR_LSTR012639 [Laodelphax striatellus]|uniref:Uncharacterized protein n=1 Tax=Laodelphax striatellus TaxID=195883 RepID=A0A482XH41_LAOST|nr:hypothetical protein LSTR_LSTR012639 [Laodelphax striatellus]
MGLEENAPIRITNEIEHSHPPNFQLADERKFIHLIKKRAVEDTHLTISEIIKEVAAGMKPGFVLNGNLKRNLQRDTYEGNVMIQYLEATKDRLKTITQTIERFLKSKRLRRTLMNEKEGGYNEEGGAEEGRDTGKRLRRTLMNEKEGGYNEEGGAEEGRDTGQYDEEMVIVVVQKEGDDPMQNEYQHLVDNLAIEEEVAYDFINEHENSVNFMNESSQQLTSLTLLSSDKEFSVDGSVSNDTSKTVTIERFLKSKRLRRTLMNEKEGGYNEEGGAEEGRDTGQYDEEMVIVVVQKEGDDPMQNEYQHLVDNLAIEEEVAYDFINEHENSVNFMNESVSSGIEQQPMLSSQVQQQQIASANLDPVARRIIGTKSLKVRNEICRLCLSKHHNMCSLFDTSLTFIKSSLKEIIETCIGIKVLRDDATDRICRACISRLESIWAFREQCEVSDRMVKQMKKVKYVQSQSEGDRNQNLIYLPNNDPPQTSNEETLANADNQLQFFCNDCERKFHTEIALAAHVTNDHAHLKPFTHNTSFLVSCSLCGRKVLKKVLHDHYLQHKLAGEDKNVTANHREAYEVEKEEEEDEEYVDDV